jgi:uncharacterized protein involved in response to NO
MTRATLGHTGRALHASAVTQAIYGLVLLAAVLRIAAAFTGSVTLMDYAGGAWVAGFAAFAIVYGRLLITRKPAWVEARC